MEKRYGINDQTTCEYKKWDLGYHEPQNMPRLSVYPLGEPLGTYLTLAESEEG
jgi:hypothetical protein